MREASNIRNYWRHFASKKTLLIATFVLLLAAVTGGILAVRNNPAYAASCSPNDVIRCGVTSPEDFKNKVTQNEAGDLPAIYAHYGIDANEVATEAVEGTAYKDGTIHVGGRVVATDVKSLGRSEKAYSSPVTINGKTYHESTSQDVFRSDSLSVLVVMDESGKFKYAIIKDCANPADGNPTAPPTKEEPPKTPTEPQTPPKNAVYECTGLEAIKVSEENGMYTYRFEVSYRAEDGATLRDVDFEIEGQDDQTGVTPVEGEDTVSSEEVTFTSEGEKYVRTVLHFDVNGDIRDRTSENCAIQVDIPKPDEIKVCRDGEIITIPENERKDTDLPEDSEECQEEPTPAEPELPSTGPAEVLGSVIGAGSIAGAGYYFHSSRRNLLSSFSKKS